MLLFRKFYFNTLYYFQKIIPLWFILNLDRGHYFLATKYDGGGPFRVLGVWPCVGKHKLLPNLIGKESADCKLPTVCPEGTGAVPGMHEDKTETVRLWCIDSVLAPLFVWLASMETDTLITILSETKIGNRSHNNRCVNFHGPDPQYALGLIIQTGSRSEGTKIPTPDVMTWLWRSLTP